MTPAGIAGPADVAAHTSYGTGTLTAGYTYMNLLFYDDFNTNTANQWGISPLGHAAGWSVVKGTYNFDGSGHTQSYAGEAYWSDYLLGVDFQLFGIANNPGGIRGRVNPRYGCGLCRLDIPGKRTHCIVANDRLEHRQCRIDPVGGRHGHHV